MRPYVMLCYVMLTSARSYRPLGPSFRARASCKEACARRCAHAPPADLVPFAGVLLFVILRVP